MRITKQNKTVLRAFYVTMFMITCVAVGLIAAGHVFSVSENGAFSNNATAFGIVNDEEFIIFGSKVRFPIISSVIKLKDWFLRYAPGIIKLLGFAVNGVEELIETIVYRIVSSLK